MKRPLGTRWPLPGLEELERYVLLAAGDFLYGTTVTPSPVNPSSTVGGPASQVSQSGIGNFNTPTAPALSAAGNGTDIVVGNVAITDLGLGGPFTDTYGPTTITVQLKIRDVASGTSGTVTFTGSLVGAVRGNGTTDSSSFVNPAFTSAAPSVTLGGVLYTVTVDPTRDFAAPGTPPAGGTGVSGSYVFHVTEGPATSPSPPVQTPPPTTPNLAPINFQYGTTVTPSPINPTSTVGGPDSQVSQAGVGSFASPSGATFDAAGALGADIAVGSATVTDLALGGPYVDTYGATTVTVQIKIRDIASGLTGTLTFTGSLSGAVTSDGTTVGSSFTTTTFSSGSATVVIGTNQYTITPDPNAQFAAPGAPPSGGSGFGGQYTFHITAAPFDEPISATPVNVTAVEAAPANGVTVAKFTDPDPASRAGDYAARIDWGDGTTSGGTITQTGIGAFEVTGTHTYAEDTINAPYITRITITDLDDAVNTVTVQGIAVVKDAVFPAQGTTFHAVEGVPSLQQVVLTLQDPNPNDLNDFPLANVIIFWGDGSPSSHPTASSAAPGNGNGTSWTFSATHTYAEAGVYQTRIIAQDAGGAEQTATGQAIVADAPLSVTVNPIARNEGQPFSGVVANFGDLNLLAPVTDFSASINWGDGVITAGTIASIPGGFTVSGNHTWIETGSYPVSVTVTDVDGASATGANTATIADPALTNLTAATPILGVEGARLDKVNVGTFTDPNGSATADDFFNTIDWGDGSPTETGLITPVGGDPTGSIWRVLASHVYSEEGNYTVTVVITDKDTPATHYTITSQAQVADAPLTAQATPVQAVEAAQVTDVPIVTFQDSNPLSSPSDFPLANISIDWGDGTTSTATALNATGGGNQTFSYVAYGTHTYAEAGTYLTHVIVNDVGGATIDAFGQAKVDDAPLTVTTSPINIAEGAEFSGVLATLTDQNPNAPITDYSATIDWGDGTTTTGTIGFGPAGRNIAGSHTWAEAGAYHVTVTLHDVDGASASNTNTAVVSDPALTNLEPTTINGVEGQLIDKASVGAFHDPNLLAVTADFLAIVDWGDGTPTQTGTVIPVGGEATTGSLWKVLDSHTYAEEGQYTITVTLTDEDTPGTTYTITSHATIADAPLVSKGLHLTGIEGMPLGGQTTADVATFTDSDPASTTADFSAVIAWGDGSTSPGVINSTGGPNGVVYTVTYAFANRHFYAEEGSYPLVVTITDVGGSKSIANGDVLIADAPPTQVTADNITVTEGQHFFLPLATFFEGPVGMPEPISDFTATIQWGDGSPPSLGTLMPGPGDAINVFGGHTYADSGVNGGSGTFHITVTIHDDGGSIVRATPLATVRDVPITLVGLLNPASDTGVSNHDGITRNNQPGFVGLSEKFSDVMLVGVPTAGGPMLFLGQTQADSAGAWSLRSRLIPDGSYAVIAVAVDQSGHTTAMSQVLPGKGEGPLVIDTVAPRINFFGFNRLNGQFATVYQDDRSGMDQHSILNGANYLASKYHIKLGDILVTSLSTLTPLNPTAPQLVTGVLNNGQIIKGGAFYFTIRSGGVEDVAGNALDGEFFGKFPTGDRRPGGDFNARVDAIHNLVFPAQPTQSTAAPPVSLASVPVPVIDTAIQSLGSTKKNH